MHDPVHTSALKVLLNDLKGALSRVSTKILKAAGLTAPDKSLAESSDLDRDHNYLLNGLKGWLIDANTEILKAAGPNAFAKGSITARC